MYSERLMALFHEPRHGGPMPAATHRGVADTPGGGPCIVLSFRVVEGKVAAARFQTYGCPAAIACAEAACRWSEGRAWEELAQVTAADVTEWVDGVPAGKEHCPELATRALVGVTALGQPVASAEG
jgi:nitrogen fixation protein NifU and related proteins